MRIGRQPLRAAFLLAAVFSVCAGQLGASTHEPTRALFPARLLFSSDAAVDNAIEDLAEKTYPVVTSLPAETDVVAVLRNEYLDAAPVMWLSVIRANRSTTSRELRAALRANKQLPTHLVIRSKISDFVLPSGPRWSLSESLMTASADDKLESIAAKYLGATGDIIPIAVEQLKASNPGLDPQLSLQGKTIKLPQTSYPIIVTFIDEKDRTTSGPVGVDGPTGNWLPIRALSESDAGCENAQQRSPVDWAELAKIIQVNAGVQDALHYPANRVVVAVLDSGISKDEVGRQRISLWNGGALGGVGYDETIEKASAAPQTPWAEFAANNEDLIDHGTQVAALIHGGAIDDRYRSQLAHFSRVMIIKIVKQDAQGHGIIPPIAVTRAIRDALDNAHASVFNLSVTPTAAEVSQAWQELPQHGDAIFIVAAGNGSRPPGPPYHDLDDEPLDPAEFGGLKTHNVVSVAALDAKGALHKNSNRGAETVTLVAPGCDIATFRSDPEAHGAFSGTSAAAPLVSAAAAILSAYGLSAGEIKNRLIASVEWKSTLKDDTVAGGVFSLAKAIDIYSDIIVRKPLGDGGIIEPGLITSDGASDEGEYSISLQTGASDADKEIPLSRLLKLTVLARAADKTVTVRVVFLTTGSHPEVRIRSGQLLSQLQFAPAGSSARRLDLAPKLDVVLGARVTLVNHEARIAKN